VAVVALQPLPEKEGFAALGSGGDRVPVALFVTIVRRVEGK